MTLPENRIENEGEALPLRSLHWPWFLTVLFPLIVFGAAMQLQVNLGNPDLAPPLAELILGSEEHEQAKVQVVSDRYRFMAAWLAFVVAAVVVSLVFFHDLFSKYDKKTKASALIFMSALASIVAASVVISPGKDRAPNHYYWGQEAFLAASKIALPGHCYEYLRPTGDKDAKLFKRHDTLGDCGAAAFLDHYVGMTKVGNLLAVVGSFSAVFGMVLHLSRPVRFVPGEAEAQDRDLKKYLYLSAILLSLGTAIYTTAGQIPIGVLAEDASSTYRHFGQSFAIFWGTAFSAIIASTYFMVLFLRQDADAIDEKSEEGASPSKRSAEFRDIVSTLVAILSPILTGLIGTNVTLGL